MTALNGLGEFCILVLQVARRRLEGDFWKGLYLVSMAGFLKQLAMEKPRRFPIIGSMQGQSQERRRIIEGMEPGVTKEHGRISGEEI